MSAEPLSTEALSADLTRLDALLAEQDEPQLSADAYKVVFRRHPAGVAVVTLRDLADDEPDDGLAAARHVGFTATSVISVSAEPPLLAFSIASTSSSWPALSRARTVAVSFLADDQDDVSARFATSGIDRFAAGGWTALPTGEAVIDDALTWVRARVVQRTPVGSSYLVSLRALEHGTRAVDPDRSEPGPLVYHDRTYHRIGEHSAL